MSTNDEHSASEIPQRPLTARSVQMVEAAEDLEGSGQRLRGAAYSIRRGIRVEIRTAPNPDEPHAARRRRTPIAVGDRTRAVEGKRVSGGVDNGGRRSIK